MKFKWLKIDTDDRFVIVRKSAIDAVSVTSDSDNVVIHMRGGGAFVVHSGGRTMLNQIDRDRITRQACRYIKSAIDTNVYQYTHKNLTEVR